MTKKSYSSISLACLCLCALFLQSCATNQSLEKISKTQAHTATTAQAQKLAITVFAADQTNPDRWKFYQDFAGKGYLPLQIEIANPTPHRFSFKQAQYAVCDPKYARTRRTEAKDMALSQVEIVTQKTNEQESFFGKIKRKFKTRKAKKEFKKIEFAEKTIPPYSTVKGWLYFKMHDGEFDPSEFLKGLTGYELEIAAVKNLDTNVVNNFYLDLTPFVEEFV